MATVNTTMLTQASRCITRIQPRARSAQSGSSARGAGEAGVSLFQAPVGIGVELAGADAGDAERAERRGDRRRRQAEHVKREALLQVRPTRADSPVAGQQQRRRRR